MINSLTKNGGSVYCHCLKDTGDAQAEGLAPMSSLSHRQIGLEFLKFRQGRNIMVPMSRPLWKILS